MRQGCFYFFNFILCSMLSLPGLALPQGEQVISGNAVFDRSLENSLTVNQASDRAIIDYDSFSLSRPESVSFCQPSSSSIALNRVVGISPSNILGTITANGRIFLINPNGIIFGPESEIDTAGMIASTLDINDNDFLSDRFIFAGQKGTICNQGRIYSPGGYIALLGPVVENQGFIEAPLGRILLASGEALTINLDPEGIISCAVNSPSALYLPDKNCALSNTGTLSARGGSILLTSEAVSALFDLAINNEGIIEADSIADKAGSIILSSSSEISSQGLLYSRRGKTEIISSSKLELRGSVKAGEISFSGQEIEIPAPLYLESDKAGFRADHDIRVSGEVHNPCGSIEFISGRGDFEQQPDSLITAGGPVSFSASGLVLSDLVCGSDITALSSMGLTQLPDSVIAAAGSVNLTGKNLILNDIFFAGTLFSCRTTGGDITLNGSIRSMDLTILPVTVAEDFTVTLFPVADAMTREGFASQNYGGNSVIAVRSRALEENNAKWAWFKFCLGLIPDDAVISEAFLTAYAFGSSDQVWAGAYHSDDSWSEFGISWQTQPVTLEAATAGRTVEPEAHNRWNVLKDAVMDNTGGDNYSTWALHRSQPYYLYGSSDQIDIASREYGNGSLSPALCLIYKNEHGTLDYQPAGTGRGEIGVTSKNALSAADRLRLITEGRITLDPLPAAAETGNARSQAYIRASSLPAYEKGFYYEHLRHYRVTSADPAQPAGLYAYHPLVFLDDRSMISSLTDINAYQFIAGEISIPASGQTGPEPQRSRSSL